MLADREIHGSAARTQFFRDLRTRRAAAHDQHCAVFELTRIFIRRRMKLLNACIGGNDVRILRHLKWTGRGHHALRLDHAFRSRDDKARPILAALHVPDFHAGTHWCLDHLRVILEVLRHALLRREDVRADVVEFEVRKAVVPRRAVGDQRIPALRAPAFRHALAFENDMRDVHLREVLAHGNSGLSGADHQRIDCFN
jgi:hypothetical protein